MMKGLLEYTQFQLKSLDIPSRKCGKKKPILTMLPVLTHFTFFISLMLLDGELETSKATGNQAWILKDTITQVNV